MRFELRDTDRAVFYAKYDRGFLWGEPGQENGAKAVAWPWGEMAVARDIEREKNTLGFLKARDRCGMHDAGRSKKWEGSKAGPHFPPLMVVPG